MAKSLSPDNAAIADALERYANLLDLAGSGYYTVRAYRRAAELIRALPTPVAKLVRDRRVQELRGIGPGLAAVLEEVVETGGIARAKELEGVVEPELVGLGRFLGIGPQRAVELGRALGARTADELRAAIEAGRVSSLPGFGPKTEAKFRAALTREQQTRPRRGLLLNRARALVETIADAVGGEPAGDPRRWADVSNSLAVVVRAPRAKEALDRFASLPLIVSVVDRSPRRALGLTVEGVPVELVAAEPKRFGSELVRATGSPEFVASLGELPDAPDEESLFRALDLPFVPPELREGKSLRATSSDVPRLVELSEIRGDLHVHTDWSDGKATVREMAEAARDLGYEYLAICDHTRNVRVVPGLECDILPDGSLDLPDDVLLELDWVQASVHAGQRATAEEMTKRVLEALRHPAVSCLSHPKGRIINHRPENALDLERVFDVMLEQGIAVETNGLPDRLDLRDVYIRQAIEAGVAVVCSTDAHSTRGLGNMQLAVATARRGWATAPDILNTRPLAGLPLGPRP